MLHAGRNLCRLRYIATLQSFYIRRPHYRADIRIFPERFPMPRPHRISAEPQYRVEVPGHSRRPNLQGGDFALRPYKVHVTGRCHCDVLWKYRSSQSIVRPVNRIDPVDDGNPQPCLFCSYSLYLRNDLVPVIHRPCLSTTVQYRPNLMLDNRVFQLLLIELQPSIFGGLARHDLQCHLRHLPDLLFQRHFRKQLVDFFLNLLVCRSGPDTGTACRPGQQRHRHSCYRTLSHF